MFACSFSGKRLTVLKIVYDKKKYGFWRIYKRASGGKQRPKFRYNFTRKGEVQYEQIKNW